MFKVKLKSGKSCNVIADNYDSFDDGIMFIYNLRRLLNVEKADSNIAAIFKADDVVSIDVISSNFELPEIEWI